ncbi:MAG TPA: phosphoribosylaminoimidazolesuccinocarboxamide synthase [Dehalococcoidia bacterium]|nr:phosphoribosylaminoimidazolesuccinocarboxamide synthase [Chloroflexota bacterium]MDP7262479.1 phosphoribosylaminoimidazolesuccinocarboxamide synthase [Dehalococcoidia bacterium]HJP27656.1 phosphoribosylaminoimidazolesuccinocarboxamide synthase [Dehalococcoidia bacterium]
MSSAVFETNLPGLLYRGKVRDTYDLGDDRLLMVASDRISAFDVVMDQPIPGKGVILTQMSSFWFDVIDHVMPNHVIATASDEAAMAYVERTGALVGLPLELARRSMVIKKAQRLDIECVVRNYIAGSAWVEYEESGTMNGEPLPEDIKAADRFSEPIFTPSTKAESGHDMPLTPQDAKNLVGVETHQILEEKSIEVFQVAHDYAAERGMILVDTKFEFGFVDGELTIIDEVMTPDSSRYWDINDWVPGNFPPAFDKQFLRAWLLDTDWNREPPPPTLPDEIVKQTQARYLESYRRLSGKSLVL